MQSQSSLSNADALQESNAKRNQAAIALAEAMARARSTMGAEERSRADNKLSSSARLEALKHQLAPLYAAIPRDVALFDLGMVSNDKPKLFVDIIAFIEMTADSMAFRFVQETRSGRTVLLETDDEANLREAVTDYIARRLIERERALAAVPMSEKPLASLIPQTSASIERMIRTDGPRVVSSTAVLASAMPLNANQAFERWTTAQVDPIGATGITAAVDKSSGLQLATKQTETAEEELAAVRRELVEITDLAQQPLPELPQVLPSTPGVANDEPVGTVKETATKAVPDVAKAAAAAVAATATVAVARAHYAPRPAPQAGWWLWPMLALLVGIGLGALLLYLYAANILRP